MKVKKIRGHRRRQRDTENWRLENLKIRWDLIERYNYHYTDIIVHPWCDISIVKSKIPEPKRTTKQLMVNGLIDIYNSWKEQLDTLNEPYYLKIWLYEPRFSKSQVVCAIGDRIKHYENVFLTPKTTKQFKINTSSEIISKLEKLNWIYALDEWEFDPDDLDGSEEDKVWFKKMVQKPHRTINSDNSTEIYLFKEGDIWIGG